MFDNKLPETKQDNLKKEEAVAPENKVTKQQIVEKSEKEGRKGSKRYEKQP